MFSVIRSRIGDESNDRIVLLASSLDVVRVVRFVDETDPRRDLYDVSDAVRRLIHGRTIANI